MEAASSSAAPSSATPAHLSLALRKQLCSTLDAIGSTPRFAAFTEISNADIKPIFVDTVGFIEFPLSDTAVQDLIEKACQTSFRAGHYASLDVSRQNAWEVDAAKLHLSPQWAAVIDKACHWVAEELGISPSTAIRADFHNGLVWGKGAMIEAHTDTKKSPGMFGTLAVCLPSEHQGGDLVLKHRNKTMSFKTSETLPSMACWFSDVSQAMLPVTSGLRIVLTYNLAVVEQSNAPLLSASTLRQHPVDLAAELAQTFRAWLDTRGSLPDMPDLTNWAHLFEKPNPDVELEYLCYVLDAIYTEKEAQYTPGDFASSMTKLNGPDRKKVEHLREMCDTQNATLFLGILDKHDVHFEPLEEYKDVGTLYYPQADWMSGYDDEPGYDPNWKPPFVIRNLIFLKGRQEVRRSMEIGKDHMKNTLVRCDNHNDLLDYRDKNFWKAIAVIVPNDTLDLFLTSSNFSGLEVQRLIPYYLAKCYDPATDTESRNSAIDMILRLAPKAWNSAFHGPLAGLLEEFRYDKNIIVQFLKFILQPGDYELFCEAVGWLKPKLARELVLGSFDQAELEELLGEERWARVTSHIQGAPTLTETED